MRRMTKGKAPHAAPVAFRAVKWCHCFGEMCSHRELSASPLNVITKLYFVTCVQRKLTIGLYFVLFYFFVVFIWRKGRNLSEIVLVLYSDR